MAAGGFSDNAAILGDTMNFPESSSVKKKEALSNVIFKITQSTEKVNKRNERLLRINLDYELRMLRLARQKEKMEWDKLNCDKLCSSQTKNWLFEEEDRQEMGTGKSYERHVLPNLPVDHKTLSNGKKGHVIYSLRRTNTAPTQELRGNQNRYKRESKSMGNLQFVDDNVALGWMTSLGSKEKNVIEKKEEVEEIDLPKIFNHIKVKWEEEIQKNETNRNGKTITAEHEADREVHTRPTSDNRKNKKLDVIHLKDIEKGHSEEEKDKKIANFTKLLKRAEESTKISSAYIPSGTTYRRLCASRKAHEEVERSKPRILTRYLREKRTFESLSKMHSKTYLRMQANDKKSRIVLSYI